MRTNIEIYCYRRLNIEIKRFLFDICMARSMFRLLSVACFLYVTDNQYLAGKQNVRK